MYVIWYGNWRGNSATRIIPAFLRSLGGSSWFKINNKYYQNSTNGPFASSDLTLAKEVFDTSYSQGTSLTDEAIFTIVAEATTSGVLPLDSNGIYLVLTSSDVTAISGFCTLYCGWHSFATVDGVDIKFSFVGNPDILCPDTCTVQSISPNGNAGEFLLSTLSEQ